jgi:hypothetical protein
MKKIQIRQGDVFLERVKELPKPIRDGHVKTVKNEKGLLVMGEGRNHGHFAKGEVDVLEIDSADSPTAFNNLSSQMEKEGVIKFMVVRGAATVEHIDTETGKRVKETTDDGHNTIEHVPAGIYKVIQQNEYDPIDRRIRTVLD